MGPYFEQVLKELSGENDFNKPLGRDTDVGSILTEHDLEILKNLLKKYWLEDFYGYCKKVGGKTEEIMCHILKSEADFRVLNITVGAIVKHAQIELVKVLRLVYGLYFEAQLSEHEFWHTTKD